MRVFSGGMKSLSRTVAHCSSRGLVSGIAVLSRRGCCLAECLAAGVLG
jgi:hypothetical protein